MSSGVGYSCGVHVSSAEERAGVLTKPLPVDEFRGHRNTAYEHRNTTVTLITEGCFHIVGPRSSRQFSDHPRLSGSRIRPDGPANISSIAML